MPMLPTLTPLFEGPFATLHDRVLLPYQAPARPVSPAGIVPARELFTAEGLDAILARYGAVHATPERRPPDRRAVISQWSKYFLSQAIYVPVAANLLLDRQLPLALDELGLMLDAEGLVERLVVPHEGTAIVAADAESRLRPLLNALLAPAITAMAAHTGIAPRALWSNAGHYYEYLIGQLQVSAKTSAGVAEGARLMTLRSFADGTRNPLYQPIRYVDEGAGQPRRLRRVCCVRYRLPELGYCGNCPLPAARAERCERA